LLCFRLLHRLMRRGTGHAHERCSSKLSGAADGEAVCARGCVLLDWLVVSARCGWRDRAGGRWWGFGGGRGGFGQDGRGPYSAGATVSCGRVLAGGTSAAAAMDAARREYLGLVQAQAGMTGARTRAAGAGIANPRANPLNAAWQAVGPAQVASRASTM